MAQARETQLEQIVNDCEGTWAANVSKVYYHVDAIHTSIHTSTHLHSHPSSVSKVYYHVDKGVASEAYTISRGRWGISPNLVKASDDGGRKKRAKGDGDGGGRQHRVAALNLPARPNTQGEHWTISHDKGMNWNTWLRFKMRAIFEYSVRAHWSELQGMAWYV